MPFFSRMLELPEQRSYFLFGARNTGKSTLIEHLYDPEHALIIDLLDSDEESRYSRDPNELARKVEALPNHVNYVIVDEIKSAKHIAPEDLSSFLQLTKSIPNAEAVCFCNEPMPKQIEHVRVMPWKLGLKQYFAVL